MAHLQQGVENIISGASYQHVDQEGPGLTKVSIREDEELVAPYFTSPDLASLEEEMALCWSPNGAQCMAHNGWVIQDNVTYRQHSPLLSHCLNHILHILHAGLSPVLGTEG